EKKKDKRGDGERPYQDPPTAVPSYSVRHVPFRLTLSMTMLLLAGIRGLHRCFSNDDPFLIHDEIVGLDCVHDDICDVAPFLVRILVRPPDDSHSGRTTPPPRRERGKCRSWYTVLGNRVSVFTHYLPSPGDDEFVGQPRVQHRAVYP